MTALDLLALADDPAITSAGKGQLLTAAGLGILTVILLIALLRFHPFIALMLGTAVMGGVAGVSPSNIVTSFVNGFGTTFGSVGILVALGGMLGKLLADSGGADRIVDTVLERVGDRGLPWAMALIAAIIGLPMFFEIGVVLLVPVVILVARRTDNPIMRVGIPALAGLSILHGLVPPHPGPVAAISALHADLGETLLFGLIVAVPTLVICGPLLATFITRLVPEHAPTEGAGALFGASLSAGSAGTGAAGTGLAGAGAARVDRLDDPSADPSADASADASADTDNDPDAEGPVHRPSFGAALLAILLPLVLMLARAIGDLTIDDKKSSLLSFLDFIGTPAVALLAAVLVSMVALGRGARWGLQRTNDSLAAGLPPLAGIMLIVAAGGGFKQMIVDAGVGKVIGDIAEGSNISPLLFGWLVAVAIRVATGSATVATITAAGIVTSVAQTLDRPHLALMALAIGAGSLFFSHVNDAGFWLVKQYFGLTLWETIKSWSFMETAISVVALVFVLLLGAVV
jgi:gluconate:H+ symporter, GntP family